MELQALWNIMWEKNTITIINPAVVEAASEVNTISDEQAPKSVLSEELNSPNQEESRKISTPADVELMIRATFEDSSTALAIAKCESQLKEDNVGDKHLTFNHKGEMLGASYGVYQVRSGGNENGVWSRPAKLGLSLHQFEAKMLTASENIAYAKQIYDKSGWNPWSCFTNKNYLRYL